MCWWWSHPKSTVLADLSVSWCCRLATTRPIYAARAAAGLSLATLAVNISLLPWWGNGVHIMHFHFGDYCYRVVLPQSMVGHNAFPVTLTGCSWLVAAAHSDCWLAAGSHIVSESEPGSVLHGPSARPLQPALSDRRLTYHNIHLHTNTMIPNVYTSLQLFSFLLLTLFMELLLPTLARTKEGRFILIY